MADVPLPKAGMEGWDLPGLSRRALRLNSVLIGGGQAF
jgi:hypothetical protein